MKLCFIHDFPALYNKQTKQYFSVAFSNDVWQRYLTVFEEIIVCSRYKEISETDLKNLSSGYRIMFRPVKDYTGMKSLVYSGNNIYKSIEESILMSDAVLIRLPSVLGFIGAEICRKNKIKYGVEVVGSMQDAYYYHGSFQGKLLSYPAYHIQKRAVSNASLAIYVTQSYLQEKYPTKGRGFNGISNVLIEKNNIFNKISGDSNKPFKIGLVGSTNVSYKGHDLALKAIKNLKNKGYEIVLELVGQGLNNSLEEKIIEAGLQENIVYQGVIYDKKALMKWYQGLDAYIQPSKTEGHCRSIVEAINNNIPTFASKVGGNSDSVCEEYLFNPHYEAELTNMLEKAINENDYRSENVINNKKNIERYVFENVQSKRKAALYHLKELSEENL